MSFFPPRKRPPEQTPEFDNQPSQEAKQESISILESRLARQQSEQETAAPPDGMNGPENPLSDPSSAHDSNPAQETRSKQDSDRLLTTFDKQKFNELKYQKGAQNLEERKQLLNILKILFTIQMIFMNVIVLLIILWGGFQLSFLRDDMEHLEAIIDMTKAYITAILVELLGGIIFIVHNVYSDRSIDGDTRENGEESAPEEESR